MILHNWKVKKGNDRNDIRSMKSQKDSSIYVTDQWKVKKVKEEWYQINEQPKINAR